MALLKQLVVVQCLVASLLPASAASAEPLKPLGGWVLDYREDQCLASREYGTKERPTTLGFRPAPNGETYEILISQPRRGPSYAIELKGNVDFGHGPIKAWLLSYAGKSSTSDIYQFRISATDMAQARSAPAVTIRPESAPNLTFSLEAMPALVQGLEACTADLKKYWNSDGDKTGTIATSSNGDVRSIFTSDDYPSDAFNRNQEGKAQFLLLIDEKGAVAGCHVLVPSGVPILDAIGCQVIRKRAVFRPARNAAGKGVRSMVTTPPIVWRMAG